MGVNNYVKMDAGFYFNPKTDALNAVTRDAYFCSLCCAKLANQDGAFKIAQIQVLTDAQETDFETLFEAGFWERTNSPNIAFVHDYLDWNLSRDEEMRRAVISRNNGSKGGRPKEPKQVTQGVNPGGKPSQVTEPGNPDPKPRPKPVKEGRKEGKKEGKKEEEIDNNNNLLRARARKTQNHRNHATRGLETHRKPRAEMRPARNQPHRGGRGLQGLGWGRKNLSPLEPNIRHRPKPVDTARNPETARG